MTGADSGRGAILRAARKAFARQPYAAVTLRDIAAEAGISASLIVKHFGSKEGLFDTVADFTGAADALLAVPNAVLGRHLVLTLLRYRREQGSDLLVRVVFAAGSGDERALLRERFRDQVTRRVEHRLAGADTGLRAELIVAHLLGLGAVMAVDQDGLAATADPEWIAERYAPGLQVLIDG
ncbi:TetR/AcrR family transcriptional regulator [Prauserella cavernicola]|uniref:TetR family transcriptional regulator n=1 Tax=Prauserella cavernicola TaxID=2800127 RepID=A0A934QNC6_9PSEU|nr:TetR/AcrR family transcriptional regulator [Prauserella cavernicola]MBK1783077.1 TetR family transcriptional regulator [Prauserella cavernicola]